MHIRFKVCSWVFSVFPGVVAAQSTLAVSTGSDWTRVLLGLAAVIAAIFSLTWLVKKVNGGKVLGGSNIQIIGGVSVGTRERIVVVQVANQWIVVGVAPGRITSLGNMPLPGIDETNNICSHPSAEDEARSRPAGRPFSNIIQKMIKNKEE